MQSAQRYRPCRLECVHMGLAGFIDDSNNSQLVEANQTERRLGGVWFGQFEPKPEAVEPSY